MTIELAQDDPWVARGYGQGEIEPGERPAVLVVDLQYAFTDPAFPLGGAPLVERAVEGTARVCAAARSVTTSLQMSFLRRPRAGTLVVRATLLKAGRKLSVVDVHVSSEASELYAQATVTYASPDT